MKSKIILALDPVVRRELLQDPELYLLWRQSCQDYGREDDAMLPNTPEGLKMAMEHERKVLEGLKRKLQSFQSDRADLLGLPTDIEPELRRSIARVWSSADDPRRMALLYFSSKSFRSSAQGIAWAALNNPKNPRDFIKDHPLKTTTTTPVDKGRMN